MNIQQLARDPLAVVFGLFGSVWAFFNVHIVESLGMAVWAASPDLFTLISLGALTLPPHVPPQSTVDWVVLAVGAIFLAKVGLKVWEEFDTRL